MASSPPSLRVTFVNRFYWPDESATAQILTDLCAHLASRGYAVDVLTSRLLYTDETARLPAHERHTGVEIHRLWSTRFGRDNLVGRFVDYVSFYVAVFLRLLLISGPGRLVVVKTDPPLLSILGAFVRLLTGARVACWSQDLFPEIVWARRQPSAWPFYGKLLRRLRNWSLRGIDVSIVPGRDMGDHIRREAGADLSVFELWNWADGEAIRPGPRLNDLRASWGLPADAFLVTYSGNLGRVHDYQTVLEAASLLGDVPQVRFVFIGSGALRTKLEAEVPPGLRDRFVFLPYQPRSRLAESLAAADVHWLSLAPPYTALVFPSKFFGIVAAGRPSIFVGAPHAQLADLVQGHALGAFVPAGDAQAFADAVTALLRSPQTREAMGQRARQFFDEQAAPALTFRRWEELLLALASR